MLKKIKEVAIRSLGVVMFAFIPGMAIGASTPVGWFWGGVVAVAGVYSSIIIFFGVQLAWDANISDEDIKAAVETNLQSFDSFSDIDFDGDDDLYDPNAEDKVD